jgi:GntR family transcriptional repressor for pyruvate dehydrogenase complex
LGANDQPVNGNGYLYDTDVDMKIASPEATVDIPFSDDLTGRLVQHLGGLSEGERLPSERDLAENLGVSRTALRDRLMRLEAIGVLERRTGSGTYLMGLSAKRVSDTLAIGMVISNLEPRSLIPVRVGLEREAARRAALRTDHINLARMLSAVDQMGQGSDEKAFREADRRFHTALIDASGLPGLVFFSDIMRDLLWATIHEVPLETRLSQLQELHLDICTAIQAKDPIAAMAAVDAHFDWLEKMLALGKIEP